jgi:chromosome segregation ATPase
VAWTDTLITVGGIASSGVVASLVGGWKGKQLAELQHAQTAAKTIESMERRLTRSEERHEECERQNADCERRYRELRADIDALRSTPPGPL